MSEINDGKYGILKLKNGKIQCVKIEEDGIPTLLYEFINVKSIVELMNAGVEEYDRLGISLVDNQIIKF